MHPVKSFVVTASLPKTFEPLRNISNNLYWYWYLRAVKLFYRLDRDLWEATYHNPVSLMGKLSQAKIDELARDEGIQVEIERIRDEFDEYLKGNTWFTKKYPDFADFRIAYFSLEFGLSEAVAIYSGGLGILAGDHLKSASDLGIPIVGVGLLYQEGFFKQYLNNDGWQGEIYTDNDFYNMPLVSVTDAAGNDLFVELEFPDGVVRVKVWKIMVGRITLVLLDTNCIENPSQYRKITGSLYGGDQEMRLKQEMLLGIGGLRALHAMDIWPQVCHMNEGHAAFLALENIRTWMEVEGLSFNEASELASAGNIFTTHTPVPAGHDRFPAELMQNYFDKYYPELGLTKDEFLALGRLDPGNQSETFCMTVLALKLADRSNAVSRLHMKVTWDMWKDLWPKFPVNEVPIAHVTNGIHVPSWVSDDMAGLFDRYLGPRWRNEPASEKIWARVMNIPDEEIWRTHERRRERLVTFARKRLIGQLQRRGVSESEIQFGRGVLDSKALTIGFARRFATYKRADLIFRDIDRLTRILTNPDMPVQIIIAGKAHPRDNEGKKIIRRIIHMGRRHDLRNNIVFIEDYDMCVARYLVQGVDIWLNNPRRPLEASGTSGMKAAANGAINLSVLDGWWDEAYTPEVGWAIGSGEEYEDSAYQDKVESDAIYDVLEKDIVPLFYDLGNDRIPRRCIEKMRRSMSRLIPVYNTDRMVNQYLDEHYLPALGRFNRLRDNKCHPARDLALWKEKMRNSWDRVRVVSVETRDEGPYRVGGSVNVRTVVDLGGLTEKDVAVELYTGIIDSQGAFGDAEVVKMNFVSNDGSGFAFEGELPFNRSGRVGFSVRVTPSHPDMVNNQDLMLIRWAEE